MITEIFWNAVLTIDTIFFRTFLGKFDQNYYDCLFKIKFGIYINSNMLNLMQ